MSKRFPHDPASAQTAPNGATHWTSYSGARRPAPVPGALVARCPVAGHAGRLTIYATDRAGGACTRVRGRYVAGALAWQADGPVFQPSGALPPPAPRKGKSGRPAGAKRGVDAHTSGFVPIAARIPDCAAGS